MTSRAGGRPDGPGRYEIRIQGRLDPRWSTWLDGLDLSPCADGTTVLAGRLVDQSALHGVLTRIRDLGLPQISVVRVGTDDERGTTHHHPNTPTGD
jgi:hypothetical protein